MLALICYTTREAQGQNLPGIGKGIDHMKTFFFFMSFTFSGINYS